MVGQPSASLLADHIPPSNFTLGIVSMAEEKEPYCIFFTLIKDYRWSKEGKSSVIRTAVNIPTLNITLAEQDGAILPVFLTS